ncbi:hypothetical protein BC351_02350 [Paenibacillus ferrarius]|uniref:Uncharacterized protein n=1 Tax=Paenibacillus ferrarius TaxID=1469647 RepID=A0A1V4HT56_9BACL|nr:hypothetical protein BC351_02350 [Paenibacillus ferrarius]
MKPSFKLFKLDCIGINPMQQAFTFVLPLLIGCTALLVGVAVVFSNLQFGLTKKADRAKESH